jgi:hypothetical protein
MDEHYQDRSKQKLNKFVDARVRRLLSGILDYTEVSVEGTERWKALRSRVLKLSNDAIRDIVRELEESYEVSYIPKAEDIIIVKKK